MMLIEETTVPDGALPVEEFKAHLRLGTGFVESAEEDEILRSFLRAAMSAIEARTSKIILERSFRLDVTAWRCPDAQPLPVAPVALVTSIELVDGNGQRTPVQNGAFWLERDPARPAVRSIGHALPDVPLAGRAEVQFVAGFGLTWGDIPSDLRQAVLMLAGHFYEFRHETSLSDGCMPFGVTSLIERYKTMRLFAGGV